MYETMPYASVTRNKLLPETFGFITLAGLHLVSFEIALSTLGISFGTMTFSRMSEQLIPVPTLRLVRKLTLAVS